MILDQTLIVLPILEKIYIIVLMKTTSTNLYSKIQKVLTKNKAKDIIRINLKNKSNIADFMIIC